MALSLASPLFFFSLSLSMHSFFLALVFNSGMDPHFPTHLHSSISSIQ